MSLDNAVKMDTSTELADLYDDGVKSVIIGML